MLRHPPKGDPGKAWLVVIIWSLVIFATIPLARTIGELVAQQWGKEAFTYAVLVVIVVALAFAVFSVIRHGSTVAGSLFWLIAVATVFVTYTIQLGKDSPEEAIHFVQYGVLGVLVFRALAFKHHDVSIYFSAAIICGIIGTTDEIIQWLVPARHWDLRDVWINFFAAALVQVTIAIGLKPVYIAIRPSSDGLGFSFRLLAVAAALMGLSMLNTPARITWYAENIPGLGYLKVNDSVMTEFGYRYDDPEIGIFRSRFSPDELKKVDRVRATEAAGILNIYRDSEGYKEFLSIYTPMSDPFLHEARVHLYSRDISFSRALKSRSNADRYAFLLNSAYRENQILEKYFATTLRSSAYVWSSDKLSLAKLYLTEPRAFDSTVSRYLITRFSELQVGSFFALLILSFLLVERYLKRCQGRSS